MKDFLKHPFVVNLKKGLLDIKTTLQEGNFKLFLWHVVIIGACLYALHWTSGKINEKISKNQSQITSIETQQRSEQEYIANKNLLVTLEPRFPDIKQKNNWLTGKLLNLYKEAKLPAQLDGTASENDSSSIFLLMSQGVSTQARYRDIGKFLERIENEPSYLRVSEVSITKEANDLGNNKVSMRFNTIFPKQKIGETLFSNYKELVENQANKGVSLDALPSAPVAATQEEQEPVAQEEVGLE